MAVATVYFGGDEHACLSWMAVLTSFSLSFARLKVEFSGYERSQENRKSISPDINNVASQLGGPSDSPRYAEAETA